MRAFAKKLCRKLREAEWNLYRKRKNNRLKNRDFTIIAVNCVGTFIYHDMRLPYLTPTVNLTISMRDLVKMAGNLKWYMEQELVELKDRDGCPAGTLGDIQVNFVHYDSFREGKNCWERRKKRINWDNIILMGAERDGCDYEVLQSFDRLPCRNKVVFTKVDYPELLSAVHIKGFEDREELGVITNLKPQILKRRYMDDFDYVAFLNQAKKRNSGKI